jgi:hypothetical protein
VLRELCPEPDGAVLKVLVDPEVGYMGSRIAVPVGVLSTWRGMQVKDGVDALLGAEVNNAI